MNSIVKTLSDRAFASIGYALGTYLVGIGLLPTASENDFIGAVVFLLTWAVDTFIVHRQKDKAAQAGGEAVATVATDTFTKADVRSIVANAGVTK